MSVARRITIARAAEGAIVSVRLEPLPIVDKEQRLLSANALVRRALGRAGGVETSDETPLVFHFASFQKKKMRRIVQRLEERLSAMIEAPLTCKDTEAALGISARERIAWYKDGRLAPCGTARVGRGNHTVNLPIFSVKTVERLLANPDIIEAWRRDDASKKDAGQQSEEVAGNR